MSVPPAISAVDNSGYGPSRKSIRTDTMKLILVEGQAKSEIYDLGRDPREDTNLADTENAEAGSLQDQLIASLEASEEKKVRIVGQEAQKATLDQSIKEQLEALGYVE